MKRSQYLALGGLAMVVCTLFAGLAAGMYAARDREAAARWSVALGGGELLGPNPGGVRQQSFNDCGPAALRIALRDLGIDRPLADLARAAGTTARGTTMLGLKQAADALGVKAEGWRMDLAHLQDVTPAIVHLGEDHFAVVRSIGADGSVILNDPARGTVRLPKELFAARWTGYVLTLQREGR